MERFFSIAGNLPLYNFSAVVCSGVVHLHVKMERRKVQRTGKVGDWVGRDTGTIGWRVGWGRGRIRDLYLHRTENIFADRKFRPNFKFRLE